MKPPTTKGVRRRLELLDAAGEVMLAEGLQALTHRRVAEAGGVALGTATYYLPGRDELVRATVERLLQREQQRRSEVSSASGTVGQVLVALLLPGDASSPREAAAAFYERLGEALRQPDLRPVVDRDYADLEEHVRRVLTDHPVGGRADLVLALVEGRLLRWLATDRPLDALFVQVEADVAAVVPLGSGA